ncbi:MAG TPA: trehalose-6-phosphate synthase [Terriglobia bacterium]|nr:trehalose-6-phosphate synthase [Terriglobia bacterium]
MRMGLRVAVALTVVLILVACLFAFFEVRGERRHIKQDMARNAEVLAASLVEAIEVPLDRGSHTALQHTLDRLGERLVGLAVYNLKGEPLAITPSLAARLKTRPAAVDAALTEKAGRGSFIQIDKMAVYVYAIPIFRDQVVDGTLAVFNDATSLQNQSAKLWRETLKRLLVEMLLIPFFAFLVVRWSLRGPIARTAQWMKDLRKGKSIPRPGLLDEDLFKPLTQEVRHFARSLEVARATAEKEARLRNLAHSLWTPERLRMHVRDKLEGQPLFVVSNREPYEHVRQGNSVRVIVPPSGLVTALEPILRACDGTWIAHGAGDADRENVDQRDRLRVPPEEPAYTLRRVWLTAKEEAGYYLGFSNEGLWPLCHIAHTRPLFRAEDWACYQEVNQKFAEAVLEEIRNTEQPAVLVQDYHFALLPRLIKEKRPDARVAIFWHIPWPNPEAFGICPWQRDVLEGLLGADLVGFHTQAHCMNFLETVDRALECRIEWDRSAIDRSGHATSVRPFPISVAFPDSPVQPRPPRSPYTERAELFKRLEVHATYMGVGVDRVDYTKGILERFHGVERFLEKYPTYQKQFTFVQMGAPSRTNIKRYSDLLAEVGAEAERINQRFQTIGWQPIVFLKKQHSHKEIEPYYRAADLCLVTSLHDGMNLVAKEFVATRNDDEGALILSHFAGASRELHDALVVNPYDTEQLADAIHFALEMDPDERRARMQRMRRVVKENNIFRWAGNLIAELAEIRIERPETIRTH